MEIENLLHYNNRAELRQWLANNHTSELVCWVVTSRSKHHIEGGVVCNAIKIQKEKKPKLSLYKQLTSLQSYFRLVDKLELAVGYVCVGEHSKVIRIPPAIFEI